jgi:hypothetical protein
MTIEMLQVLVSIGGLVLAAVGLPLLYLQLRGVQRSIQSAAHAAMYEQAAAFRAHLVEHPHLRKYFFAAAEITPEHEDYDRVVTIAELFLNYLEHISVLGKSFGRENRPALERFSRISLEKSPVLRRYLAENRALYSDTLHRLIR